MRVAVIGTGYVGLVAGAGFASFGNDVTCVDIDADRVARLKNGEIPIYEPGLDSLVARNSREGRLHFTTDISKAVPGVDAVFIAVGTPQSETGAADLSYVLAAARDVGKSLTDWAVVATKSTVPVGTADKVRETLSAHAEVEFSVASNPEFLKEGDAVNDFMKPDRVILGVDDDRATRVLRSLYEPFVRTGDRIMVMDPRSAELTKYAANALLASRISFMNQIAMLAEKVGADVETVRLGVGTDARIGPKFLFAGPGFGGSCFPKDIRALIHTGAEHGVEMSIVRTTDDINEAQKKVLGDRVKSHFGGDLTGKTIAVWGLAFKPKTDDIREAPALVLIDDLLAAGATVRAYDPEAMPNVAAELGDKVGNGVELCEGPYEAAQGADALVLVTEWPQFRRPDFRRLRTDMNGQALFDGRNIWNVDEVRRLEFSFYGIGRGR